MGKSVAFFMRTAALVVITKLSVKTPQKSLFNLMWKNQSNFGYNTEIKNIEIMKKIVLLISLVIAAATLNAQDFYIGGGFDKAFIVYPDNSVKDYNELVVCGQYDKLDLMFGIVLNEPIAYTKRHTLGLYVGRNVSSFSFGGYFGYDFAEYNKQSITIQSDMLLLGVYAKYSIFNCMEVFAFYKVGYDNNNSYSKFCDRGFGIGITIGFGHSDKEYTTKYYYD